MSNIPIFDSLVHPTINGDWILPGFPKKSCIDDLLAEMEMHNVFNAFAVGLNKIGAYDESKYCEFVLSKTDKLFPIAYFNVNEQHDLLSVISKIKHLKSLKYHGIKLHPRIGKFNLLNPLLPEIIKAANDENLVVFFCTYFYESYENVFYNNPGNLLKLLIKIPEEKIILLHGGGVSVLEYMEIARVFPNVLLDLSYTLCKYKGSSLDMDIQFLFNNFDRRICIGSDFPEFTLNEMRQRFEFFTKNITSEKAENIAYKNIFNFIQK